MESSLRVRAPAKVNLHLRVYGKRQDGFHGLRSLFQTVSLADDMVVRSLKTNDTITIVGTFDCPPESTTIHAAVLAFRAVTGLRTGVAIEVSKRIPAGAGLGGGSSDAAATVLALDALFGTGLTAQESGRIGAAVGSDVPFFVHGGTALVEGRGELVEPVPGRRDLCLAVAFPGMPVSTAWAYALLDAERSLDSTEPDPSVERLLAAWTGAPETWPFLNTFFGPVSGRLPVISLLVDRLRSLGAGFAAMSGSGSAVFGTFPDMEAAERAAAGIREESQHGSLPRSCRTWAVRALAHGPALG